jgi:hypothetical protein
MRFKKNLKKGRNTFFHDFIAMFGPGFVGFGTRKLWQEKEGERGRRREREREKGKEYVICRERSLASSEDA